jgi:uncharacterized protein with GYD domain
MDSMGVKTESWYWAYGADDILIIVDGEPSAVVAIVLAVGQTGVVELTTTPLMTSDDLDAARARLPQYRAPGT